MRLTASISEMEVQTVQDGVAHDVRSDGRTLTQRRPLRIDPYANVAGASASANEGSCAQVHCDGTVVIATAVPSVVEVPDADPRGPLHISIDAAQDVVDHYAEALRSRAGRYRHAFLSHVAATIRQTFGAETVTACEPQGVADAELIDAAEPTGPNPKEPSASSASGSGSGSGSGSASRPSGFPGAQLYIGHGHAFRVDVDARVLRGSGGNVCGAVAVAVHVALRAMRLPAVTFHPLPASGAGNSHNNNNNNNNNNDNSDHNSGGRNVSVEVDRTRAFRGCVDWSALPVLAAMRVSPTRHYVVDPTALEEIALPRQMHVAANATGQVCYARMQQFPSRRGDAWRGAAAGAEESVRTVGVDAVDLAAMLHDAQFVCQAIIAECDEALRRDA